MTAIKRLSKDGMRITEDTKKSSINLIIKQNISQLVMQEAYGVETDGIISPSPYFPDQLQYIDNEQPRKKNCPFHLPPSQIVEAPAKKKKEPTPEEIQKRLEYEALLRSGEYTVEKLMGWLLYRKYKAPIIGKKDVDGGWAFWQGALKGTVRYSKDLAAQMKHEAFEFDRRYLYKFFVTYTFDARKYTADRVDAWRTYSKTISKICEKARKKFGMGYMWVLESTFNGYPHAHIVYYTNKLHTPGLEKFKAGRVIHVGEEYKFFKKWAPAPVMRVEWAKGKGTANYLVKYIAKSAKQSLMTPPDGKNKKKLKAWIKDVLTLMAPTVVGARGYGRSYWWKVPPLEVAGAAMQQATKTAGSGVPEVYFSEDPDWHPSFSWLFKPEIKDNFQFRLWLGQWRTFLRRASGGQGRRLRRAALDWLLTNSERDCLASMRAAFCMEHKKALEQYEDPKTGLYNVPPPEIERNSVPIGCVDCLIKRIFARYRGENVSLLVKDVREDGRKVASRIEPSPETRDAATLEREKQDSAKKSLENSFYVAGYSDVWNRRFAPTRTWSPALSREAMQVFDEKEAKKASEQLKEQAIKEASMSPEKPFDPKKAHYSRGFLVRVAWDGGAVGVADGVKRWLKVGELPDDKVLPEIETTDDAEEATVFKKEEYAKVYGEIFVKKQGKARAYDIVMNSYRNLIVDGGYRFDK